MGERVNGIHEVRGSIPLGSTNSHLVRRLGAAAFVFGATGAESREQEFR